VAGPSLFDGDGRYIFRSVSLAAAHGSVCKELHHILIYPGIIQPAFPEFVSIFEFDPSFYSSLNILCIQ